MKRFFNRCYNKLYLCKKYLTKKTTENKIIVSLTSYPKRIDNVQATFESIFSQTKQPDKIVLWLSYEEFPNKEKDLPKYILDLVYNSKIDIEWCENLKPHKKYFYALQKYKDCIVITIDDDLIYENDLIESLLDAYEKFPNSICAKRTHIMQRENNKFTQYKNFVFEQKEIVMKPSMQLLATSGAGTLFPPNILNFKFFDENLIKDLALLNDDLWLKVIEVLSNVSIVQISKISNLQPSSNSQECALWKTNNLQGGNDNALEKIRLWADAQFGTNYLLNKIFKEQETILYFSPHQDDELLSMGIDICCSIKKGANVHVILCTDGSKSQIRKRLNDKKYCKKHEGQHIYKLSKNSFIHARDCEYHNSCLALGVLPSNIHISPKRVSDKNLTITNAKLIIRNHIKQYNKNNLTVCTIYFDTKKQHSDHRNLGLAAFNLYKKRKIKKIKMFKEPYCKWDIKTGSINLKAPKYAETNIINAIKEYSLWKPEDNRYAIGYHSVSNEFSDFQNNMETEYIYLDAKNKE